MRCMSRLLPIAITLLMAAGLAPPRAAHGQAERSLQNTQEKAAEAAPKYELQAAQPGTGVGGTTLDVKGRFNCKCISGEGQCILVQDKTTLKCHVGGFGASSCKACRFVTSAEQGLAPE